MCFKSESAEDKYAKIKPKFGALPDLGTDLDVESPRRSSRLNDVDKPLGLKPRSMLMPYGPKSL